MCVWTILKLYNLKILCIFTFVELCIMSFLIFLVRKYYFPILLRNFKIFNCDFRRSQDEIKNVENVLSDVENKTSVLSRSSQMYNRRIEERYCLSNEKNLGIKYLRIVQLMFGLIDFVIV
ncbi:hypothetical protein ACFW04_003334 [Cataglyphis niger]